MSRGQAALLAAIVIVLAFLAWMLATRPDEGGPPVRRAEPEVVPPAAATRAATTTPPIRPRPIADEDEPASRAATRAAAFTVTVLDDAGAAVTGAVVGIALGTEAVWHGRSPVRRTDAGGKAAFADIRISAGSEVLVAADGFAPLRQKLEPDATAHVVRLGGAESISGHVTIDGAPPPSPFTLMVYGFLDPTSEWPEIARGFLANYGWGESRMKTTTKPGGAFSVRGLPPGQLVRLEFPRSFRFREIPEGGERTAIAITTPRSGVSLDLVSLPVIMGRPVLPPASPLKLVTGLSISVRVHHSGSWTEYGIGGHVGSEFSFPIERTDATGVTVEVFGSFGVLARRTHDGPITRSVSFGDIPLEATMKLNVVLKDAAGAPIAGGRVAAAGQASAPTDAEGKTMVPLTLGATTLMAGAAGYRIKRVPIGATPPDPMTITLEEGNRLVVEVRMAGGALPPAGVEVCLSFSYPLPPDAPEHVPGFDDVRGTSRGSMMTTASSGGGGAHEIGYPLSPAGSIAVSDVPAAEAINVQVKDRYDQVLVQTSVEVGPTGTKTLKLEISGMARTIAGVVVDAAGVPLRNVEVSLGFWPDSRVRTNERGAFTIPDVLGAALTLSIRAPGYANLTVTGPEVFTTTRFVLEAGRSVWVQVVAADGSPAHATVTLVFADGTKLGAVNRADGSYEVERAPKRPATVEAKTAKDTWSAAVGADQSQVRVVVGR